MALSAAERNEIETQNRGLKCTLNEGDRKRRDVVGGTPDGRIVDFDVDIQTCLEARVQVRAGSQLQHAANDLKPIGVAP